MQDPLVQAYYGIGTENKTPTTPSDTSNQSQDPLVQAYYGISPGNTNTPQNVTNAMQNLDSHDYEGLCEVFAEKMTNQPKMGLTAAEAFQNYAQQGKASQDLSGMQPGDLVYFKADNTNGGNGHVAIFSGNDNIVNPDYSGVHMSKLSDWMQNTGQQPLGFVRP